MTKLTIQAILDGLNAPQAESDAADMLAIQEELRKERSEKKKRLLLMGAEYVKSNLDELARLRRNTSKTEATLKGRATAITELMQKVADGDAESIDEFHSKLVEARTKS